VKPWSGTSSAAREGLTNVARHARATECRVTLNVDSDVTVTVDDNGVGVVPNTAAIGYGLRNLHKRAETLGGTAQLDSGPDGGTRLTWCVPVVP
jgi:signal transduction histidine kinase